MRPVRRIVCIDDQEGKSKAIHDGPSPDVRTDPARPGFSSTRIWVTDGTPARLKGVRETVDLPHTLEPPSGGSVCRIVAFPPEERFKGGAREVRAFFQAMGSPGASTYSARSPHPYMHKTRTLDFCLVLEGEITLVLDAEEVHLKAGNRSGRPCTVAISSHDATY